MIYHIIMSNAVISLCITVIIAIRHFFHIPPGYSRIVWIMCLILMAAVFLPDMNISVLSYTANYSHIAASGILNVAADTDFYISSYSLDFVYYIWIAGVLIGIIMLLFAMLMLIHMEKTPVYNEQFENLCAELNVKAHLYTATNIKSPISFGILNRIVIIPEREYSNQESEFIFLHELYHHKHRDAFINIILNIVSALYWFNPLVYIMANLFRLDMELYCDMCVIRKNGDSNGYGKALLYSAECRCMSMAEHFSDFKKLRKRLETIAQPVKKTSVSAKVSVFILSAVLICAGIQINTNAGVFSRITLPDNFSTLELDSYFRDKNGCFVLFDSSYSHYYIYNTDEAVKRSSPDSTYKIALTLNGLENNVISADSSTFEWDGVENPFAEWDRSHDLFSAMQYSVNWYFQRIDSFISNEERHKFLAKTGYGNQNTGWSKKAYWLENSLEISPLEQADFIRNVYNNSFGFDEKNVTAVLDSIRLSDNVYGKTGTGNVWGQNVRGWFVGAAEFPDRTFFFALEMTGKGADGITAQNTAINILNDIF